MALSLHNPILRRTAAGLLVVVTVFLLLVLALVWGKELDARHTPFAFAESFDFEGGDFADYVAWSQRRLRAARPDASDDALAALAPFRLEPEAGCAESTAAFRNGVVLTHDVLDSAYMLRELGRYFQSRCFVVYALLLPGHGTRPGELLETSWEEWSAAESFAARELAREVDNLYLAGHGAGGTLAILEASRNAGVDGLVLFAPQLATRARPWRAFGAAAFGWLEAAHWEAVIPAHTLYQYESRPYRLQEEVNALVDATLAALPARPFEVPVLAVISLDDISADVPAMLTYMAERRHPLTHTVLYGRNEVEVQPGQTFVSTYYPDQRLLSLSHAGLTVPPEDPEFGFYGASRNCGHYYRRNAGSYAACMAGQRANLGELTPENLAAGVLERTDFNMFFHETTGDIDRFISPVAPIPVFERR